MYLQAGSMAPIVKAYPNLGVEHFLRSCGFSGFLSIPSTVGKDVLITRTMFEADPERIFFRLAQVPDGHKLSQEKVKKSLEIPTVRLGGDFAPAVYFKGEASQIFLKYLLRKMIVLRAANP